MNLHIIKGRLVRDPEFTKAQSSEGSDRVNFTVAVDRRFGDETDFYDCVAFGKLAGVIDKWCNKGKEIVVSGEGHINSYTGKDGVKRKSYSIFVNQFDFCGSAKDSKQTESGDNWQKQEEDIPF